MGALLALAGGGWIALSALRGPSEQEAPPGLHRVLGERTSENPLGAKLGELPFHALRCIAEPE